MCPELVYHGVGYVRVALVEQKVAGSSGGPVPWEFPLGVFPLEQLQDESLKYIFDYVKEIVN